MTRPTVDRYFTDMARLVSTRGTCARRQVGCVLVNVHRHVLSTGYNGPPSGHKHCVDEPCLGMGLAPGTGLELCEAVHAEANALLQCRDVREITAAYVTHSPCVHCTKLLMNTGCQDIIFSTKYAHDAASMGLWLKNSSRRWIHHPDLIYRHKKRGTLYRLEEPATLQSSHPALDMTSLVVYRALSDGTLWVRPKDEFYDGRFEEVTE